MTAGSWGHADAVGDAIRATAEALGPWVGQHVEAWPPDRRGRVSPHDPSYLVGVILDRWKATFEPLLGAGTLASLHKFRDLRNRWAHHEPLDAGDVEEVERVARKLYAAIGATYEQAPVSQLSGGAVGAAGHRKARSAAFRREQWEQRLAPHVAPVNHLVDELIVERLGSWMPYVAPYHGGSKASVLLLFQDPGPMTHPTNGGSGFLGCENDDPSAETLAQCLDRARLGQREVTPWNAYPWFLPDQKGVSAGRREEGVDPLLRLLERLPSVHTVVTLGKVAHDTWARLERRSPTIARPYRHLRTFHTSGRGITNGGQQSRDEGIAAVVATLMAAGERS